MRYIDNRLLQPPADWQAKADTAYDAVINRGENANDYGTVWRALKDKLADLSHDKCWYCEIKQERSDNAVDHFRPKALYRWLAFKIENFCYSCTFCNSRRTDQDTAITGGKGDHFPLVDGASRSTGPGGEGREQPLLLNPCSSWDPALLDFDDSGRPTARYPDHAERRRKAETSIRFYHLDHTDLIETRRKLAIELNSKIDAANDIYDRVDSGDAGIDRSYAVHVRDLKLAMAERAELSTFAKKVISGRRDLPWIEALLSS